MGRPARKPTAEERRTVKAMAGLGVRSDDIAKVIKYAPKTMRKHFREELDLGMIEANAKVAKSLFDMATKGKNTSAAIFWAKVRCGFTEGARATTENEDVKIPPIVVKVDRESR